ncbi:hypothetical protein SDC9_114306 [bioreactor metagenome]|uniref:Uncharacterized protein n=1 Tax=bioreactor metagenome TaxID=1076179 RepID=A0A645C089_9ZZZZ
MCKRADSCWREGDGGSAHPTGAAATAYYRVFPRDWAQGAGRADNQRIYANADPLHQDAGRR